MSMAEGFRKNHNIRHYYRANETILHTEPYEQLFRPGDVIVGADSHSIFHGGLGALSIGLGAADVMMAAVLGSFILKVPEAIRININGKMPAMLTGKDVILSLLQRFKRNTVAFERTVEYGGDGLKYLSASDRGTLCNMGAEFGAMTSFVPADEVTVRFILNRRDREFADSGAHFFADEGAPYVAHERMDLSDETAPKVGVWPSPDNVYDVNDPKVAGHAFETAFIGTCTTTPEEYVLAGLTAEAAIKAGWTPSIAGEMARLISPSSLGIFQMLSRYGLVESFEKMGFKVGRAGCSLCLAIDGHQAPEGTWVLGSHNRPFPNRTGKGSKSMVTNAATVVSSSASMRLTDPRQLLPYLDRERHARILADLRGESLAIPEIRTASAKRVSSEGGVEVPFNFDSLNIPDRVRSRVVIFGDNVDTDAIIPGRFCHLEDLRELGLHAFENEMGEGGFRKKIEEEGKGIVVAGTGWGSGSSREEAAYALQGNGVQMVIAQSIAFIHQRNLVNQAIPFRLIHSDDREAFYRSLEEGMELDIDLKSNVINVPGQEQQFRLLPIHPVEQAIQSLGGLAMAFQKYGEKTLEAILQLAKTFETH